MAYKSILDRRECSRSHYQRNKASYLAKNKRNRQLVHDAILGARNRPCHDCGLCFPVVCMDFDHVRGFKEFNLGGAHIYKSLTLVLKEIEKCEVVCSNCHRIRTAARAVLVLLGDRLIGRTTPSEGVHLGSSPGLPAILAVAA